MTIGLSMNGCSHSKNQFEGKKQDWLDQKFGLRWGQRLEAVQAELWFLFSSSIKRNTKLKVSRKLPTHPTPNPCFSLMCDLRTGTWIRGGVGWLGSFPETETDLKKGGSMQEWQMLCLIAFFLILVDAPLCNGDVEDTDSRSVDMESIPEQKGQ